MSRLALSPDQFKFTKAAPGSMGKDLDEYHRLDVLGTGSSMLWHHKTGVIGNIGVPEDQQRRGIATQMWQEGHRIAGETRGVRAPRHSTDRTKAGDAWARSVSKRVPKLRPWPEPGD